MGKIESDRSTGDNWSDCTPAWGNSSSSKMLQRENFLQKSPRKTKLTQNYRDPQVLTDNEMDNKRCWSVVLPCVEVQNPGQSSTCKCTPISRKKITTKQYTPHPYLRRYRHVKHKWSFLSGLCCRLKITNPSLPIPRTDNQYRTRRSCVLPIDDVSLYWPLFVNLTFGISLDFLLLCLGMSYSKRVSRQESRWDPFKTKGPEFKWEGGSWAWGGWGCVCYSDAVRYSTTKWSRKISHKSWGVYVTLL